MDLSRSDMDADKPVEIDAYVFTPSSNHYVVDFDFGPGISIVESESGGEGCEKAEPYDSAIPNLWETTYVFPICLTLQPQPFIAYGDRTVSIDVESNGTQIRAQYQGFRINPP